MAVQRHSDVMGLNSLSCPILAKGSLLWGREHFFWVSPLMAVLCMSSNREDFLLGACVLVGLTSGRESACPCPEVGGEIGRLVAAIGLSGGSLLASPIRTLACPAIDSQGGALPRALVFYLGEHSTACFNALLFGLGLTR